MKNISILITRAYTFFGEAENAYMLGKQKEHPAEQYPNYIANESATQPGLMSIYLMGKVTFQSWNV